MCTNSFQEDCCLLHSDKSVSNSFQVERNTIVVIFFFSIMNQTDFRLVQNQKENCHYVRILFNLKGIRKKKSVFMLLMSGAASPKALPTRLQTQTQVFPSYLLCALLSFPFHVLPSPVHHTGFSFCLFSGFLAILTLLSQNNNNNSII